MEDLMFEFEICTSTIQCETQYEWNQRYEYEFCCHSL